MTGAGRATGLVLLPDQALHDTGAHPENSRRIPAVLDHLRRSPEWDSLTILEAREAAPEDILRAHSPDQLELVRAAAEAGPTWIDGDTPVSPESYRVALKAAGAAMAAVDEVVADTPGSADSLFALIRPPGHHATPDRAMGFCLFNNAAVAARYAADRYGLERVAVLDWDVHHGNGTQDALWRDPGALFISLHQWPLYPGTGWLDEVGAGEGEGFTVNLPMPPGSGDAEHDLAMGVVVEPILEAYDPELVIVSAGQDAHAADQLAHQMISTRGYHRLAERVAEFAGWHGIGVVALHEGGYNLETLPRLDQAILAGLGNFKTNLTDPYEGMGPGAPEWPARLEEIKRVQSKYWPV
jgi:acetoin utilization deacetylase AcuC-like enzyme